MKLNTNLLERWPGKRLWGAKMNEKPTYPPITFKSKINSTINHPAYYGGEKNTYEAIKVIEAWDLNFHLGNVVKYISRAGKKDPSKTLEDIQKAKWYLDRYLEDYQAAKIKKTEI